MDWDGQRVTVVNTNPNHNPGLGPGGGVDDAALEKERSRNSFRCVHD